MLSEARERSYGRCRGETTPEAGLGLRLEESGVPHLLSRRSGVFVALLPYAARAVEALREEVGSPIGLSEPVVATARMSHAHREAMWVLQGARASGRVLVRYGEDAASPFLPRNIDESRAIVHQILGPMLEYDAEHGTPLMTSLRTYLSHDRSLKATSEVLHVHKQTVVYRMRRVEELTGRRMGRMEDIANLWLTMKALDPMGQNGEELV